MPRSAKSATLARQWEMLQSIPSRPPGMTTREVVDCLAERGYEVSLRTVERDLIALSRIFGLTTTEGKGGEASRWYFATGKGWNIDNMDLVDAVSLALAGDLLKDLLPTAMYEAVSGKLTQAREKLRALEQVPLARWSDKVRYVAPSYRFLPPPVRRHELEVAQQALAEGHQIELEYTPFNQNPKCLILNPLSMVLRGNVPYLVATAFDFTDARLYAVHRMRKVRLLQERAVVPKGFSIDAYLAAGGMDFGTGKTIKLKARLTNELAQCLTETRLAEDQSIDYRNGHYQLTATVRGSWQLMFWILSQGSSITVLQPAALKRSIRATLEESLSNYNQ